MQQPSSLSGLNLQNVSQKKFLIFFPKKNPAPKKCPIFREMELCSTRLNKTFYTLDKTTLGETGWLTSLYYLLAAQVSSFLIHPHSQTQSVRTPLAPYHTLCNNLYDLQMPCHTISHQALPTQHFLGVQRISLGVASILRMCFLSYLQHVYSIVLD